MNQNNMSKPTNFRLNNRVVTFLNPKELRTFREAAYQQNLCTAELIRAALRNYLHLNADAAPYKA